MKLSLLVLFLLILTSCKTPSSYFGRPDIYSCVTLKTPGLMACDGVVKEIPSGLIVPESNLDYETAIEYYEDKEMRLYKCLRYNKCQ